MFMRSCVSAFRQYVRTTPAPICRKIHTNRVVYSSDGKDETNDGQGDSNKRVTIILEQPNGKISTEIGFVNERLYDLVRRVDKEETLFKGFGACSGCTECATCHVILNEKDFSKLPPASEDELDIIDCAPESCEYSRLACNIHITEEMEGMIFKFPSVVADFYANDQSNGS